MHNFQKKMISSRGNAWIWCWLFQCPIKGTQDGLGWRLGLKLVLGVSLGVKYNFIFGSYNIAIELQYELGVRCILRCYKIDNIVCFISMEDRPNYSFCCDLCWLFIYAIRLCKVLIFLVNPLQRRHIDVNNLYCIYWQNGESNMYVWFVFVYCICCKTNKRTKDFGSSVSLAKTFLSGYCGEGLHPLAGLYCCVLYVLIGEMQYFCTGDHSYRKEKWGFYSSKMLKRKSSNGDSDICLKLVIPRIKIWKESGENIFAKKRPHPIIRSHCLCIFTDS